MQSLKLGQNRLKYVNANISTESLTQWILLTTSAIVNHMTIWPATILFSTACKLLIFSCELESCSVSIVMNSNRNKEKCTQKSAEMWSGLLHIVYTNLTQLNPTHQFNLAQPHPTSPNSSTELNWT